MELRAIYDDDTHCVNLIDGDHTITLDMDAIRTIFKSLNDIAVHSLQLTEPDGVHYPTGIGIRHEDGALRIIFDLDDGAKGQFVLPAHGKSADEVSVVSRDIMQCFHRLFALN